MVSRVEMKIRPLDGFRLVEGYFGITGSLKRISEFYGYAIDEETLLGLGGGLGFVYWQRKGMLPQVDSFGRISDFSPVFLCIPERVSASIPSPVNPKHSAR